MNFKIVKLYIKEKLYDFIGKNNMEVKLERYRSYGAKIEIGCENFIKFIVLNRI